MSTNIHRRTHYKATPRGENPLTFIMSDGTPDRHGDIVDPNGWLLAEYRRNPTALFNHNSEFIVGKFVDVRIRNNALVGTLQLAPEGTSPRIDEIRKLTLAGLMNSVSVGFIPHRYEPRPGGGKIFREQTLIETSLTPTPANPNALREQAQALGVSDPTIDKLINNPPKHGSLAQRADHARRMLAAHKAQVDESKKRRQQAESADFAKRMRQMDAETRRDQELVAAFKKGTVTGLAKLTEQHAADEARAQKKENVSHLVRSAQFERKFQQLVDEGCDPEDLMKNFLARL